jgi:hypothetical protein
MLVLGNIGPKPDELVDIGYSMVRNTPKHICTYTTFRIQIQRQNVQSFEW